MWPILGSLLTGATSLVGSFFSSDQSARNTAANIQAQQSAQHETMAFNAQQAALNRDFSSLEASANRNFQADQAQANRQFQEQMSSTAFQRARADMDKAGLNPILAARSGASTPGGSMASGSMASGSAASVGTPNMALHNTRSALEGLGDAVQKAVSSAIQIKTFDKMTEEIANIQADTAKVKATERLVGEQERTQVSETARRRAEATKAENEILKSNLGREEATAILNMPRWLRDAVVQSGYTGGKVGQALEALPMLGSTAKSIRSLLPSRSRTERHTTDTRGHGSSTFEERFTGGY